MNEIARTQPVAATTWQPGDVVLDTTGAIRVRSDHPHWVWGYPDEGFPGYVPSGSLAEAEVEYPLTLIVRDRRAVHTVIVQA